MLRVSILLAVVSLAAGSNQRVHVNYAQAMRDVLKVGDEVKQNLVEERPGVKDPKRYYVVVVRVVDLVANSLLVSKPNLSPTDVYVKAVNENLPLVLQNPLEASKAVEKELLDVTNVLKDLLDLYKLCDNVQDLGECNDLVSEKVNQNSNLKLLVPALQDAQVVAQTYLSLRANLMAEVKKLNGVGFLQNNRDVLTKLSVQLSDLLKEVKSLERRKM